MNKTPFYALLLLLAFCICCSVPLKKNPPDKLLSRLEYLKAYPLDSTSIPRSVEEDGSVRGVGSGDWTSGFFSGSLMYAYELTNDSSFLERGAKWSAFIKKERFNASSHDIGFQVNCSYGHLNKLRPDPGYISIIEQSATTLVSRFDATVGCIRSWDFGGNRWKFPVIIDNMMNLELLFEAYEYTQDSTFKNVAISHADKTLENHYRGDYSCFHVVDYDPDNGDLIKRITFQGYKDESAWARGQSWGLYGFTMAYRYTQDSAYLKQAHYIADFLMNHAKMPEDKIPYWDYDAPITSNTPKDASAAAIMASALVELYTFTDDERYLIFAKSILQSLNSEAYLLKEEDETPFILAHSTGNMPNNDEIDVPINYADYYFLEALVRLKHLER